MASHRALRDEEDGLGWGGLVPTKEERRIESLEHKLRVAEEALVKITKREGAFDRDKFVHACNALDSMEAVARAALAIIREKL